jgi:curved DNA-binding protein
MMNTITTNNYYSLLGVSSDADPTVIRKAFRTLARQYHPDLNPGDPAAEQHFKQINEAYQILSDSESRFLYDHYGEGWRHHAGENDYATGESAWQEDEDGVYVEPSTAYNASSYWASHAAASQSSVSVAEPEESMLRGRDMELSVRLTLEEAFHGAVRSYEQGIDTLDVQIPPGVCTGSRICVSGAGIPGHGVIPTGDLYLNIVVLPHEFFSRWGHDLHVKIAIDPKVALLGGEVEAPALDQKVRLTIPPDTPNGQIFRLQQLGMPLMDRPDLRGDLYVEVDIQSRL